MLINQKPTGLARSMPAGLTLGWLAEMCVTLVLNVILAMLIAGNALNWDNVGYGIMAMILTGAFTGAWCASRAVKRQKLAVCTLSGLLYLLTLAAISVLFFEFELTAFWVTGLLAAGGSAAAALIGNGEKRTGTGRKRKHR